MKILVFTPFKVGSTTLFEHLRSLPTFGGRWYHQVRGKKFRENFVVKAHLRSICIISKKHDLDFDIIFTIIRKPTDIYLSAYFQDIHRRGYPYFFGGQKKVLETPVPDLLSHFLSFSWDQIKHLNYGPFQEQITEHTGVNIFDGAMNRQQGYHIYRGISSVTGKPVRVCVMRLECLEPVALRAIYRDLELPEGQPLKKQNVGERKWYAAKYKELKAMVPPDYRERYRPVDQQIEEAFDCLT